MSTRTATSTSIVASLILLFVAALNSGTIGPGTASNDAFIIRYCVHNVNPPNTDEAFLFIFSNGTAQYSLYVNSTHGNWTQTWSGVLSSELVSEAFQTMNSEDFMSLDSSYEDHGWPDSNHTERACIEIAGMPHMVSFQGRSMMGVIPGTYAILNNICYVVSNNMSDIPDATLSITVTKPDTAEPLAMIAANFTNNGDTELYDTGLCNVSWPTFVISTNGTTVGDLQGNTFPLCLMTFPPQSSKDFGPWEFNYSALPSGEYVVMSQIVIWTSVLGNFSSNSSFVPDIDEPNESPGQVLDDPLILAGAGAIAAIVVLAVVLGRKGSKGYAP